MKQKAKIMVAAILAMLCGQSIGIAQTSSTNGPATKESEPATARAVIQSFAQTEKLWEEKPIAYFHVMHKNAKQLVDLKIDSDEDYQIVFNSFTNMISKSIPVDDKHSAEMLSLQSSAIENFMRNGRIRHDRNAWIAFARYLGEIRAQIPSLPASPKGEIVVPPSIDEWQSGRAKASYQAELGHENMSLTSSLLIYMENLANQGQGDKEYFQQLADLAKLTEEERAKLEKQ